MNERIRELIKQAQVNDLAIDTNGDPYDVKRLDPEKFAELIVRECAQILFDESERLIELSSKEANPKLAEAYESCHYQCIDDIAIIEMHFGVEE